MNKKEYLNTIEISKENKVSIRNVIRKIHELKQVKGDELIHKDSANRWQVHYLLLSEFKRKNLLNEKYYALSIDPCYNYSDADIDKIMSFVYNHMADPNIEIHYTIERKKANEQSHLHCYINCKQRRKLIESLRLGFSQLSYKETEIYDLNGWKKYITKEGNKIKSIKN